MRSSGQISIILCFLVIESGSLKTPLEKCHLRIVIMSNPPYYMLEKLPNGTIVERGVGLVANEFLSRALKCSYSKVYPTEEQIKQRGFNAPVDILAREQADIYSNPIARTLERERLVKFSSAMGWEEPHKMVVPKPTERGRLFAFVLPFEPKVWLLLGISSIIVVFTMSLLSWCYVKFRRTIVSKERHRQEEKRNSFFRLFGSYSLFVINVLTTHGDYLGASHSSFVLFVSLWLLSISVLVYGYSCIVMSSLTVPILYPAINSLEDLLKSQDVLLLLRRDAFMGSWILDAEDGIRKSLADKARKNPETILKGADKLEELLSSGHYAFGFYETYVRFFIANQKRKDGGKCRFQMTSSLPTPNNYNYFALSRSLSFERRISQVAMIMWETGISQDYAKKIIPPYAKSCFEVSLHQRFKQSSIKLKDLTGAFFLLALGCTISFFVFILELTAVKYGSLYRCCSGQLLERYRIGL